jgi:hypothetical protein
MNGINVHDNLLSKDENDKFRDILLYHSPFFYGEGDRSDIEPTGIVCDFTRFLSSESNLDPVFTQMIQILLDKIYEKHEFLSKMNLYRIYLNLFTPNEKPYFHIDGDNTVTCLYYLNPDLDINEGGETQFLIDEEIRGVISKPGRLAVFDGGLKHRATSFRTVPRLTMAFKFI